MRPASLLYKQEVERVCRKAFDVRSSSAKEGAYGVALQRQLTSRGNKPAADHDNRKLSIERKADRPDVREIEGGCESRSR